MKMNMNFEGIVRSDDSLDESKQNLDEIKELLGELKESVCKIKELDNSHPVVALGEQCIPRLEVFIAEMTVKGALSRLKACLQETETKT